MKKDLPDLRSTSALDLRPSELAEALDQAFTGYLVPIRFHAAMVASMIVADGVDLGASRIVHWGDTPAGIALIARRGTRSRLAAMGIAPEFRGRGIGRWCLEQLLIEARKRGERTMLLEVIAENTAAVQLYARAGFEERRRLVGYTGEGQAGERASDLLEIDLREAAAQILLQGAPDLPWQLSGETMAQQAAPTRAFRLGPASLILSNPEASTVSIRAMVVAPEARRQGWARRLVQAVQAEFPGKTWRVPILWPEEEGPGLFEGLGMVRELLTQIQMIRSLWEALTP